MILPIIEDENHKTYGRLNKEQIEQGRKALQESLNRSNNVKYEPCGGCGNDDPRRVCIGCMHPFTIKNNLK